MNPMNDAIQRILEARHHDPFSILGAHQSADETQIRVFQPHAKEMHLLSNGNRLKMENPVAGFFQWSGREPIEQHYQLSWQDHAGSEHSYCDPYSFDAVVSDFDLYLFAEGRHHHAWQFLGADLRTIDGVEGVFFATWAPNAERISIVGDFNQWDGRCHPMRNRGDSGIWELFIPGLKPGELYKMEIRDRQGHIHVKADPYARQFQMRPDNACIIDHSNYQWSDGNWISRRSEADWQHAPMSIYEVHLGSWKTDSKGGFLNYRELADLLVKHVTEMGFTHIELLPITEHPFDGSWGYQATGYFAPTSRFGTPDEFRYLIDRCHQANIGVILDWVPAHFPKDAYALARFDGSPLYEHEDPRRGEHRDWGTLIFNYGRNEVRNYLLSSALYWIDEYHIDGLRVDAVASMLYLDYSRAEGDWIPNIHGGNENLEAIDFLREMNVLVHEKYPGALTMAEESTSWPMVSRPTDVGGLGFSMKWNMGWMNDTLDYIHRDPVHRKYHHSQLTFGQMYAYTENFILPFSHDEVVHMKRSMLDKMPGDDWQRFSNLRLLYTYMFTMPGKKLLFMGNEFAQGREWNEAISLDWFLLDYPRHNGIKHLIGDLNRLYAGQSALHIHDFEGSGFSWLDCDDAQHSILSYRRMAGDESLYVALNFTPVPHQHYRIGVSQPGRYEILFNSDSEYYGGSNMGNIGEMEAIDSPWNDQPYSIGFILPALAGVILRRVED